MVVLTRFRNIANDVFILTNRYEYQVRNDFHNYTLDL